MRLTLKASDLESERPRHAVQCEIAFNRRWYSRTSEIDQPACVGCGRELRDIEDVLGLRAVRHIVQSEIDAVHVHCRVNRSRSRLPVDHDHALRAFDLTAPDREPTLVIGLEGRKAMSWVDSVGHGFGHDGRRRKHTCDSYGCMRCMQRTCPVHLGVSPNRVR